MILKEAQDILNGTSDKKYAKVANYLNESYNWEFVINIINNYYNNIGQMDNQEWDNTIINENTQKYTHIHPIHPLNIWVHNISNSYIHPTLSFIDKVLNDFLSFSDNKKWGSELIINFAANSHVPKIHKDRSNNIALQLIGKSEWSIYPDLEGPFETHLEESGQPEKILMEPGDLLIIKNGTAHKVAALEPRASVLVGFDSENSI